MEKGWVWAIPVTVLIIAVLVIGNSLGWFSVAKKITTVVDETNKTLVVDVVDDGIQSSVQTNSSLFGASYNQDAPDLYIASFAPGSNFEGPGIGNGYINILEEVRDNGSFFSFVISTYKYLPISEKPNVDVIYVAQNICQASLYYAYISVNDRIGTYNNACGVYSLIPYNQKTLWWTEKIINYLVREQLAKWMKFRTLFTR